MRILVTGAAGFIGANLVRAWSEDGHEVHAAVRPGSDRWRLVDANAIQFEADLARSESVDALLRWVQPEVIVNAAAYGAYPHQQELTRMLAVNVSLVCQLVEWARIEGIPLLHLGSSSEYGLMDHPASEDERLAPNSTYAVTKAAGSHLVCDGVERCGLRAAVFRLYSVYGQWEEPSRLMPTLVCYASAGRLPPALVDPAVSRDFVHVDDVVKAATAWIRDPIALPEPAVLNIASGVQTSLGDLVAVVCKTFGVVENPRWGSMERRRWDTSSWVGDVRRARALLSWSPEVPLSRGLMTLATFVSAHPDRYQLSDGDR